MEIWICNGNYSKALGQRRRTNFTQRHWRNDNRRVRGIQQIMLECGVVGYERSLLPEPYAVWIAESPYPYVELTSVLANGYKCSLEILGQAAARWKMRNISGSNNFFPPWLCRASARGLENSRSTSSQSYLSMTQPSLEALFVRPPFMILASSASWRT